MGGHWRRGQSRNGALADILAAGKGAPACRQRREWPRQSRQSPMWCLGTVRPANGYQPQRCISRAITRKSVVSRASRSTAGVITMSPGASRRILKRTARAAGPTPRRTASNSGASRSSPRTSRKRPASASTPARRSAASPAPTMSVRAQFRGSPRFCRMPPTIVVGRTGTTSETCHSTTVETAPLARWTLSTPSTYV